MQALHLIVRVAAATLWLLLAWRLVWAAGGERVVRLFVPLALGLAGFLAGNTAQPALLLPGSAAVRIDARAGRRPAGPEPAHARRAAGVRVPG